MSISKILLASDTSFIKHDIDHCFSHFEESKLKYSESANDFKTYGLNRKELISVRKKVKKQEDYLKNNTFITSTGQTKSLAEVSFGANTSKRYYPRILNKVDTFVSYNLSRNYTPVFLTVTLDGFFRDFLKGDFKRWTKEKREDYLSHIPNNDRNGYYLDMIDNKTTLTPKDLYKVISHQLHRFIMSQSLRKIRKDGEDYSFIRVTEPHGDGTPHFHILMYVPEQYLSSVYKEFKKFFPAPRNHKKINYRDNKRDAELLFDDVYETQGFQTKIRSVTGYILKYILKSFRNLINEEEIDYLQAWYVHNRIPRIITTHTLIPQDIYHKTAVLDDDWYYLTNIKLIDGFTNDRDNNYFIFDDGQERQIIGDNGYYRVFNKGRLVKQYGTKIFRLPVYRLRSFTFTAVKPDSFSTLHNYKIWIPPKQYSYYRVQKFDDGTIFCFGSVADFTLSYFKETSIFENDGLLSISTDNIMTFDDVLKQDHISSVSKLTDFSLFSEHDHFDFDVSNPKRYGLLHNELITRGLLRDHYVNLNDFNTDFEFYHESY